MCVCFSVFTSFVFCFMFSLILWGGEILLFFCHLWVTLVSGSAVTTALVFRGIVLRFIFSEPSLAPSNIFCLSISPLLMSISLIYWLWYSFSLWRPGIVNPQFSAWESQRLLHQYRMLLNHWSEWRELNHLCCLIYGYKKAIPEVLKLHCENYCNRFGGLPIQETCLLRIQRLLTWSRMCGVIPESLA